MNNDHFYEIRTVQENFQENYEFEKLKLREKFDKQLGIKNKELQKMNMKHIGQIKGIEAKYQKELSKELKNL